MDGFTAPTETVDPEGDAAAIVMGATTAMLDASNTATSCSRNRLP
jgi:hypothetical protein